MSEMRLPSRRQFLTLGVGAFVVAATPAVLSGRRRLVRRSVPLMGTVADLAVVHPDSRYGQAAIEAAVAELRRVERAMTRFSPVSDIGRANRLAGLGPVPVGRETAVVLAAALRWAEASGGAFDPALGGAVELWDVGRRREPPEASEAARFAGRGLHRAVELTSVAGGPAVLFHDRDVSLDLGGIAKGYGVDRAARALSAWGIRDGLVNVGGDLFALGCSEDGDPWEVGVRSPGTEGGLTATLRVSDEGVATSGDYEQFFEHDGRRYHHILDPASGEPRVTHSHSLTVAAASCMAADAAGTAAFGMSRTSTERLLRRAAPGARIVHLA